jgi:invasion protein IalB
VSPALIIVAALLAGLLGPSALAQDDLEQTVGAWTVTCHQTEAGGRECQIRNDEDGKPALEQSTLLSFTLHDGSTEAAGLVRIADLELPPRLEVELALGGRTLTIEGVGRRGRLAARFAVPRQELPRLAAAETIAARFADKAGEGHEIRFPTTGLAEALALADRHL